MVVIKSIWKELSKKENSDMVSNNNKYIHIV